MRKSAVSLACEILFFAVDTIYGIILALTHYYGSDSDNTLVLLAWQLTFPIRCTAEAMSTEMTRAIFFESIDQIRDYSIVQVSLSHVARATLRTRAIFQLLTHSPIP